MIGRKRHFISDIKRYINISQLQSALRINRIRERGSCGIIVFGKFASLGGIVKGGLKIESLLPIGISATIPT